MKLYPITTPSGRKEESTIDELSLTIVHNQERIYQHYKEAFELVKANGHWKSEIARIKQERESK